LRFAMAHPAVVTVVLGAANPAEVSANAADAQQEVPAGVWSDLKSAGVLEASVPIG
jgi:D-threo-aldose 1-dehydrogenase